MGDCCTPPKDVSTLTTGKHPSKMVCTACGEMARSVEWSTLLHQLKHPLPMNFLEGFFYFCTQVECDVVYFGIDDTIYQQNHLRQEVGQKSKDPSRLLCYCFGISEADVRKELDETGKSPARDFVTEQIKMKRCACDIRNPSGKCCLKDFPRE